MAILGKWLDLELDRLSLSPLRPKRPLPLPDPDEIRLARELGFVDPVTARPLPGTEPARYEIVSGEKPWLTAQKAGLPTVSVRVRDDFQDADVRRLLGRQAESDSPDPIREALALRRRVQEGPAPRWSSLRAPSGARRCPRTIRRGSRARPTPAAQTPRAAPRWWSRSRVRLCW